MRWPAAHAAVLIILTAHAFVGAQEREPERMVTLTGRLEKSFQVLREPIPLGVFTLGWSPTPNHTVFYRLVVIEPDCETFLRRAASAGKPVEVSGLLVEDRPLPLLVVQSVKVLP